MEISPLYLSADEFQVHSMMCFTHVQNEADNFAKQVLIDISRTSEKSIIVVKIANEHQKDKKKPHKKTHTQALKLKQILTTIMKEEHKFVVHSQSFFLIQVFV